MLKEAQFLKKYLEKGIVTLSNSSERNGFHMNRLLFIPLLLASIVALFPSLSPATQMYDVTVLNSTEGTGSFAGRASYSYLGDDRAALTVELTNTSPTSAGYITALAFLLPNKQVTVESITAQDFNLLSGPVKTPPFDNFDFGASIGEEWLKIGSSEAGIKVGDTKTFTFNLTGPGLDLLSINDFTRENNVFTAVRFAGLEGGGSDKALGVIAGAQVPEPATLLLFGSGILGYTLLKKRSRKTLAKV
ncbi:MAG: PEP-CTERM sorting domain-containing protein [Desulfobacteraceae bacterium]|nr:MAG: PEP-CTERM sorting domain-containing protein [Desulfobacteraceae bacterium]